MTLTRMAIWMSSIPACSYIDDVDYPREENIHWFMEKQMNFGTNKILPLVHVNHIPIHFLSKRIFYAGSR